MCNRGKLKIVSGITAAVLLGAFLCPLQAQEDTRSREDMVKACHAKVEKVKEGMHRWASEGGNPHEVGIIMRDEFGPCMHAGNFHEAEKVLNRALDILKKGPPVPKPKEDRKSVV